MQSELTGRMDKECKVSCGRMDKNARVSFGCLDKISLIKGCTIDI